MKRCSNALNGIGTENYIISEEEDYKACILAKNQALACIIQGETGTGKEEFAKLIHKKRECLEGQEIPFVSVNCANINNDLSLSLLFGHVKGAFSGADKSTDGLITEANGGILFLDEIHALSFETQQKLLRVLNDGSYSRLGDTKIMYSKFQVIAATTKDLDEEVAKGNFILDLRSRLLGIELTMKPLRERKDEMPGLLNIFLKKNKITLSKLQFEQVIQTCRKFYWQGNIRQFFHVLNAWVAMCDGDINIALFPEYKNMLPPSNNMLREGFSDFNEVIDTLERAIALDVPLGQAIEKVESFILEEALSLNRNITDVYQGMKLSRNNFYIKRRKYGLM